MQHEIRPLSMFFAMFLGVTIAACVVRPSPVPTTATEAKNRAIEIAVDKDPTASCTAWWQGSWPTSPDVASCRMGGSIALCVAGFVGGSPVGVCSCVAGACTQAQTTTPSPAQRPQAPPTSSSPPTTSEAAPVVYDPTTAPAPAKKPAAPKK